MIFKITKKEAGLMIKEFICPAFYSSKALKRIKMNGKILVNQVEQTVRYVLQVGDKLEVILPKETTTMQPSKIPLSIVYEDDDFLIIDKQSGIPSIPTKRYPTNTLANALVAYYQEQHIDATVHLVNRLDKDTSGLLLVAKSGYMHHLMSKNIKQVKRTYHCIVEGILQGDGTIHLPIAKKDDSVKRYIADHGKPSITHYRVLQNLKDDTSLVECVLETGRTHQIRVHMAALGHPLVGDTLYGSSKEGSYYLDSVSISFIHPKTNKQIILKK